MNVLDKSIATGSLEEMAILLDALTRFRKGDAEIRLPQHWTGLSGKVADVFNDVVEQNAMLAAELVRLRQVVGKEGQLKQRAAMFETRGFWGESIECVNALIDDLVHPTTEVARVIGAVAQGDLSKSMALEVDGRPLEGEFLRTAKTINKMVEQLGNFSAEVTRVAREVGTEGKLGGQAKVKGVAGTWKDLTDSVNSMAGNLTDQVRNIADVTTAVAKGDLSKKIDVDVKGEFLTLRNTINTMVDQLRSFASEVTRVAREVGTEGSLGGQARVEGVSGTWKDLTDSVNSMAGNLTSQVRNIADVTKAVAAGDLSKKITVDVKGEILELKNTVNTMVDQLNSFAAEVTRVAREVGTEGKLGGQADVQGVAGTWKDLTESVNFMAGNLTSQVRNIADVTKAVAAGDLSKKITVDVKGEISELKNTINTMVDQLNSFAAEVTRVAREVGTEGKLGGQADVQGVAGTWKDLTESVNSMAGNLTDQVRNIADVTTAVAKGDLSKKITVAVKGEILELKNTVNTMVDQLNSFAAEVTRVAREVGTEGKLGGQADVQGVAGTWKDLTDSVNSMASNLTSQVRNIADVTKAVAAGDLSKKITVDVKGEILELKATINTMVDQLSSFAAEVTRVAREVGTEGRLGGQAQVRDVSGTWKDLTDNVNFMAGNLTGQVRGIAKVVTAVANGDLQQKLMVEAKGEIAALAETINSMTDTLATFADQVTTVAREVGVEGKLGGQAKVPGAAGTWKGLTENVNQLAANLTTQVRAIAEVATAVTQGDLTRSITVEARGEVAALKDTINEMIRNLKDTTQKNTEQDWLKTNLAKFSRMLQGQKDLLTVGQLILSELAPVVGAQQAEFYMLTSNTATPRLKLFASYASGGQAVHGKEIDLGQGLVGQCAVEKTKILLTNVPSTAFRIATGLSEGAAMDVIVLPVIFEGEVRGVLELASLERFNPSHQAFLDQLTESIGIVINTISANMRTEDLLTQSQSLAEELQSRQQELQQTNEELQEKARLLVHQNQEVERKNQEVEQARQALEEKAEQLALTSKYKSEFLANMSHELRTPLNSLLILSDQLCKNSEGNLTARQVEFAKTIHLSGNDLLMLINDILDLSKIESGTVAVELSELRLDDLQRSVERSFRHVAEAKHVDFDIRSAGPLPETIVTDVKRLQQIIKNLLSNAFKFTHQGSVAMTVSMVDSGWSADNESLNRAGRVMAFSVADTGIGISADKQQIVFEAFQQADGSTSRKYGGTGLGLAISRELARLLGGEIRLASAPAQGSTFTLYLPQSYSSPRGTRLGRSAAAGHDRPAESRSEARKPARRALSADEPALTPHVEQEATGEMLSSLNIAEDDRDNILPGEKVLLVVENDLAFARMLLQAARRAGYKGLVSPSGAGALALARDHRPMLITLDIYLPDMEGWRILERLKADLATRHIPICVVSTDDSRERAMESGAVGFLAKPLQSIDEVDAALAQLNRFVETSRRKLLIAMQPSALRDSYVAALPRADIDVVIAESADAVRRSLGLGDIDAFATDGSLDGLGRTDVAEFVESRPAALRQLPVLLYSAPPGGPVPGWEHGPAGAVMRVAESLEALIDATAFSLHRGMARMSERERRAVEATHQASGSLAGRKVLIVDDDMRNIFALAAVLDAQGMAVVSAENGRDAIRLVKQDPSIDIVLMDIMMPEMDGMQTMRELRKLPRGKQLPLVAVTAKAMKGDREKCIEAGAWDYLSKPVDTAYLLMVLRGWLCK
ncbi:Sensory/regulatory protein RpfC [Variovorax sp. PBS-H4]|uniref:HAMP domain-containing protein n=1 Tax=Variovorax sp. PBS-H4 TaxID=434008 RepID=UPI0013182ECA|nr:HAMP domain-containing protein [Variovorax sp. PBS-H4]VTU40991.1 Sensory/regulatory protein RpfC [Variovorax sp. PBS-H4]